MYKSLYRIFSVLLIFMFKVTSANGKIEIDNLKNYQSVYSVKTIARVKFKESISTPPVFLKGGMTIVAAKDELYFFNTELKLLKKIKLKGYVSDLVKISSSKFIVKSTDAFNDKQYIWVVNKSGEFLQSLSLTCSSTTKAIFNKSENLFWGCRQKGLVKLNINNGTTSFYSVDGIVQHVSLVKNQLIYFKENEKNISSVDLNFQKQWEVSLSGVVEDLFFDNKNIFALDSKANIYQLDQIGNTLKTKKLSATEGRLFKGANKIWGTKKVTISEKDSYYKLFYLDEHLNPVDMFSIKSPRVVAIHEGLNGRFVVSRNGVFNGLGSGTIIFDKKGKPVSRWGRSDYILLYADKISDAKYLYVHQDRIEIKKYFEGFKRLILPKVLNGNLKEVINLANGGYVALGEDPEVSLLNTKFEVISSYKIPNARFLINFIEVPRGFLATTSRDVIFLDKSLNLIRRLDAVIGRRDSFYTKPLLHSSGKVITMSANGVLCLFSQVGNLEKCHHTRQDSHGNQLFELNNKNLLVFNDEVVQISIDGKIVDSTSDDSIKGPTISAKLSDGKVFFRDEYYFNIFNTKKMSRVLEAYVRGDAYKWNQDIIIDFANCNFRNSRALVINYLPSLFDKFKSNPNGCNGHTRNFSSKKGWGHFQHKRLWSGYYFSAANTEMGFWSPKYSNRPFLINEDSDNLTFPYIQNTVGWVNINTVAFGLIDSSILLLVPNYFP